MNRREFLGASAVSLLGASGCRVDGKVSAGKQPTAGSGYATDNGKLAGLTLKQLRRQYRYDLFDDFLPFMDKYVVDHKYGGFLCNTDRDGTHLSTEKNSRWTGRGIWVYSFLYNKLERNPKYLEIARKSVELILKSKPSGDNLWPSYLSREGKPLPTKKGYHKEEVYDDLFIANGLAEYSRAIGDDKYWDMAKDILLKCMPIYDRSDYSPNMDYSAGPLPGPRTLGHWMLLIRFVSQMLGHRHDPQVEAVADRCIDAIFNYHYNPECALIGEILNHDMSRPQNAHADRFTAHSIETLWMVLYEAHRRRDKKLFEKASRMLKRHLEVFWDDVYGGFYITAKNIDENIWELNRASPGTLRYYTPDFTSGAAIFDIRLTSWNVL